MDHNPALLRELSSLSISEEVYLFQLSGYDLNNKGDTFCFSNTIGATFGRVAYQPIACKIEGIEFKSDGPAPTPNLTVADPANIITNLAPRQGFEGCSLLMLVTHRSFLDDLPSADATAIKYRERYTVTQRLEHIPGYQIKFEVSTLDFINKKCGRPATRKCPYSYRGEWCRYTGTDLFTIEGARTLDPSSDECGRERTDCEKRKNGANFGGFVGLQRF